MKCLALYKWLAGSKNDFLKPFQHDETLQRQAKHFIDNLDKMSWSLVLLFVAIALIAAVSYYIPYNNQPGRHYKPSHWLVFLLVAIVLAGVATFGAEYLISTPKLDGAMQFEVMVAVANAVYAGVAYFVASVVWCNCSLPTNAYRMFKF